MKNSSKQLSSDLLQLPYELINKADAFPVFYLDAASLDLAKPESVKKVNKVLFEVLCQVHSSEISGQVMIKVHIGEPRCTTRLRPEYTCSSNRFLQYRGAESIVAGDTTVAYSGPRSHKQNPLGNAARYMELAHHHGWSAEGIAGIPFVVLDRPCTSLSSVFEFTNEQEQTEITGIKRFNNFFPSGGFLAADFVINHAHLTLHGLAGVAGCVKSIAMGCSGLKGKLRMHQSLLPFIDPDLCEQCGICVKKCPENALTLCDSKSPPELSCELCIGCGECVSVCRNEAVTLQGKDIFDWQRGEETLYMRMADYVMGLMNGRWKNTIHVLHMYSITELCDCVDQLQKPMVKDLGFLISKNPFAIDKAAGEMLKQALKENGCNVDLSKLKSSDTISAYTKETYGITTEAPLNKITI